MTTNDRVESTCLTETHDDDRVQGREAMLLVKSSSNFKYYIIAPNMLKLPISPA